MKSGRTILTIVLLFIGLLAVNYLASALPLRIDTTAGKIYTLSPGTRKMLSKLEEPVRLEFYFSRSAAGLPVQFKNYASRVQAMLQQYVRASDGKLELAVIEPKPDTPTEEKAAASGLTGQPMSNGETLYFGLVATHADQQQSIAFFNPQREQFLEYDLSQIIHRVQDFNRRKLGLLSGLPLRGVPDMRAMQMGRMPQSQFIISQWEQNFEVVTVEANASSLPDNLDALAVIHPQNVSEDLQFAIDQFLLAGKPVFLAVDPSSRTMRSRTQQMGMMSGGPQPGGSSNLPALLSGWGLDYKPDLVVGDLDNATQVQTSPGEVTRFPVWLSLQKDNFNRTVLPTSQLDSLLFIEPGAVSLATGSTLTFTPLVQTSAQSGTVQSIFLQFGQPDEISKQLTVSGMKTIAALVLGKFKSAFPNGAPKKNSLAGVADPGSSTNQPGAASPATSATALKESKTTSTLMVVTDADWLMDDYSVRRLNFLGTQAAEPLNSNLAFASNAIEYLAGSEDLISIRGKSAAIRPFTVVKKMEAAAQREYQDRLTALDARLSEVQTKLTELRGKKTEGNRLVATPEMAKAIEDFQKQQAALRGERRQIRAALREEISALENHLILLNLLVPALFVGLFGFAFFRHRQSAA